MVLVAFLAVLVAAALVLERWRRRRNVRRGLQAIRELLLWSSRLQHYEWLRQAERAVLLQPVAGRMQEVVRQRWTAASSRVAAQPEADGTAPGGSGRAGLRRDVSGDVAVGGAVGVTALADWWHVDENVSKAVEALTHEHVSNSWEMWSAVQNHFDSIGPGLFMSLRGHVGEQMVAEHLEQAGLRVEWPHASNQPGWDLDVQGTLVNVKVIGDAAGTLQEHFARYPNIPAVVNADADHLPADALTFDPAHGLDPSVLVGDHLTLVDQALDLHEASSAVHDAFGADALTDTHIPVVGVLVTAVRSGVREGKLVRSGDTDRRRAVKNVAVDTTARGVGVIAGAKAAPSAVP